jgi:hypothetical protein
LKIKVSIGKKSFSSKTVEGKLKLNFFEFILLLINRKLKIK